jgi:PAS domain S-box-containing protein
MSTDPLKPRKPSNRLPWRLIFTHLAFANLLTAIGAVFFSDIFKSHQAHYAVAILVVLLTLVPTIFFGIRLAKRVDRLLDERDDFAREVTDICTAIDAHAMLTTTDIEGRITFANDHFCQAHGFTREELIGFTHSKLNSGYHSREFFRNLHLTLSAGREWSGEIRNRKKDGSFIWLQTTISPVLGEDGRIREYIAIRTDITDMKLAQIRVLEQRVLLSQILEVIPASIFWKDRNSVYGGCNGKFARDAGLKSSSEIIGRSDFDMPWKDSEAAAYRADDQQVMQSDKPKLNIEESQLNAAGEMTWLLTSKVPLHDRDGNVIGVVGCYADITGLRQAQTELLAAKDAADAANRAKSEFLANMSHEIRTPMTAILGFAELLAEDATPDEQKDFVSSIQRNGQHLLTVINDILDLSKIEAGKFDIEGVPTNPAAVLQEVVDLLHARALQKKLTLQSEVEEAVPRSICSDPTRLRQILLNLVGNALKFTEHGQVHIRLGMAGGELRFEITDTGPGMSEETIQHLFTPFTQADTSSTRRHGGTGLGLVISQRLASLLNGTIEATSQLGSGSTFTLILRDPVISAAA